MKIQINNYIALDGGSLIHRQSFQMVSVLAMIGITFLLSLKSTPFACVQFGIFSGVAIGAYTGSWLECAVNLSPTRLKNLLISVSIALIYSVFTLGKVMLIDAEIILEIITTTCLIGFLTLVAIEVYVMSSRGDYEPQL